ncbi:Hypothetical protein GbCGDNIH3_7070 [Granulibacter bethesdensis]|uniref:Uncharacterized protein n=1 Tax=Granulibacter bethesdensis TaxID=364410 RepID=A0AAN0REA3_9PROT|nr:hypothetical protein [Granulibacter bethesdensis]AHJ63238.1 Hypothetical protein GbCGDNIH3_7070 [Granulibacter bethesdensis]
MAEVIDFRDAGRGARQAFQVDAGGDLDPPDNTARRDDDWPILALGHLDGSYHFLDVTGQKRVLTANQLYRRGDLMSLFGGVDAWLRTRWPLYSKPEEGEEEGKIVGFRLQAAAAALQKACVDAGLYGDHIVLRRSGIWPAENGLPAVHCGDAVLIGGRWYPAGTRTGNQIWEAAPRSPRPGAPCGPEVARDLQEDLRQLWNFQRPGGEIIVVGLLGTTYLGGSINWRPAGFLTGPGGCGKTQLLNVLRSCSPLHHYTTDTTKAGLETALSGRAMPSFIEEAVATKDAAGARVLINMVLASVVGEGTKGHRYGENGRVRKIEMVGSIIMASDYVPEMKQTHLGRFAIVDLCPPQDGTDYNAEHKALMRRMSDRGPAMWGRVLASWQRYHDSLDVFRSALKETQCAPREMDQYGALLAGWWILTQDRVPDERDGREGVAAIREFVRTAEDVAVDGPGHQVISRLMTWPVAMQHTTNRIPIGVLLAIALFNPPNGRVLKSNAYQHLLDIGIRTVRADETSKDKRGRPAPRMADCHGIWINLKSIEIEKAFKDTEFDDGKWRIELGRLESARIKTKNVRIGSYNGGALWISAPELGLEEDEIENVHRAEGDPLSG